MAIIQKPFGNQLEDALQKFIQTAPDAAKESKPAKPPKAHKEHDEDSVQITLRLSRTDLERLTKIAKRQGIPRANYMKRAVFVQLEADEAK